MTRLSTLAILTLLVTSCTSSQSEKIKEPSETPEQKSTPIAESLEKTSEDQYTFVLRHVDNRAVLYINDSIIFDTGEVAGGPLEREIDLTTYVLANKTNLKVELYNTNPPTESIRPGWMIVYDIFVNEELVEFISEKKNESTVGIVYTEIYDLTDIW